MKKEVKKEVVYVKANEDVANDVRLFLEKYICIEDLKAEFKLELVREELGSVIKEFSPREIESSVKKLSDYGLNMEYWDTGNIRQSIVDTGNELMEQYFHKNVGWIERNEKLEFRGSRLIGSKIKSNLKSNRFQLNKKGTIEGWVEGINNLVLTNRYMEIMVVIGFTSIITRLVNKRGYLGSLIFNYYGGVGIERDTLMNILKSIWGEPMNNDGEIYQLFNGNMNKFSEFVDGNDGLSVLVKDISNSPLLNLVNYIQSIGVNSTIVINSNRSLLRNKNNVYERDNISELDLDVVDIKDFKDRINDIEKIVKMNHGLAGEKLAEIITNKGIETIESDLVIIENEIRKGLRETDINSSKIQKMAIVLLTSKYLKESIGLEVDVERVKNTLLEIDGEVEGEQLEYNRAIQDVVEYFHKNKRRFIRKDEDIKANTLGIYEVNADDETSKLVIPTENFRIMIKDLGYDRLRTLKTWRNKGLIETEDDKRNDKKVTFGTSVTRCITIIIKRG